MGDDIEIEHLAADAVDGHAGTVYADWSLVRDVTRKPGRCLDFEPDRAGVFATIQHLSYTVHMTAHQMAAKGGCQGQRLLQIHATPGLQVTEGGQGEGLAGHVRR